MNSKILSNYRVVVVLILFIAGCTSERVQQPAEISNNARQEIDHIVQEIHAQGTYPGISVAVAATGKVVYTRQVGYADIASGRLPNKDTMFRMYSLSKGVTQILADILAQEGKLNTASPVNDYLPGLPKPVLDIAVDQLLNHTSGIRHYRGVDEWVSLSQHHCDKPEDAFPPFINDPLVAMPGTETNYSSFGYVLLSAVIVSAGAAPFDFLLQEKVFKPSGVTRIELDDPDRNTTSNVTTYYESSASDVSDTFDVAFRIDNSCKFGGGAMVASPAAIAKIYSAYYAGQLTPANTSVEYATGRVSLGGEGLGGRSALVTHPQHNLTVVVAANARGGDLMPFANQIADIVLSE
jgi:serine beta-lactamase-like protein LACTB